ncbi:MAG TPA: ATP-binding protein [Verrucomicrobiae bacterium]|nr:ATP-binding protein [Verrucomicrobiae bacterium]
MNHVPRSWLQRFQASLAVFDLLLIGVFVYTRFLSDAVPQALEGGIHSHGAGIVGAPWGVTSLVAGLALFQLVYLAGFVWWLDKKYQLWRIHAPSVLITGIILSLLVNADTPAHMPYHILLMIFMFLAAMVGTLVVGLTFSLAFTLLIIGSLGSGHLVHDPSGHVIEMILVSLSGVAGSAGWFVFHKKYVQAVDTKALASLTNLIKQERTTVSLILESIADGVMVINTEGIVQVVNASCAKMLGWTKEDAQNLQYEVLLQLVKPEEKSTNPTPEATQESLIIPLSASTGQPQQQVSLVKTRDGRQIYVDITASPIFQEERAAAGTLKKVVGVIVVLRDVDKQKREEQQRSEFISTASHEMRTPVAAIEGYLALALNAQVSQVDAKARSFLEKAHASTEHLGKLFQDLLTSAKAEDGRLVSHPQAVEMGAYLEQLVDSLRFAAEKKGLLMDFTVGAGNEAAELSTGKVIKPLYFVHVDPDRLREVITNLFDNAVKYTPSGKISVGLTGNQQVVQFFIRDTGPGIPANDVPHLFQKFYRVDNSATRTVGGTGLGLFICRKIVELYKGRIWAESELGQGSSFYINLPRIDSQKASELQTLEAQAQANTSPLDNSTQH